MSEDVFPERYEAAVSYLLDARDRLQTESRARERLEGIAVAAGPNTSPGV